MPVSQTDGLDLDAGFLLGGVTVLPRQYVVVRDGERLRLEPKVMAILLELVRLRGEVVGRSDFADTVWRGRVVSDEVLSRNVSVLRSALGDDAKEPRFIQTTPQL
jgi:DNA-binding winged helix-turn-helix (wHTH) protein